MKTIICILAIFAFIWSNSAIAKGAKAPKVETTAQIEAKTLAQFKKDQKASIEAEIKMLQAEKKAI